MRTSNVTLSCPSARNSIQAGTGLQPHPSILKVTDSPLIEAVDEDLRGRG